MATERLSMRHTREILRQKLTLSRSHRAIAQSLGLSSGTVGATVLRARAAGLDWLQVEALTDDALEGRLYGLRAVAGSRGRHTTDPAHMPKAHQRHLEWTPSRIIGWAQTIGPQTAALVEAILADRPHPEQGYRSCLGILRLAKRYDPARLEAACARAGSVAARSYRHVDSILKHGLAQVALPRRRPAWRCRPPMNTSAARSTTCDGCSQSPPRGHRCHAGCPR